MKTNNKDIDLIEKYLDDNLDPEELALFNERLDRDPGFRRLFVDMDRLVEGIRLSARKTTLEEKLANLEKSLPFQKSGREDAGIPVISMWEWVNKYKMATAAVISMLFIATFLLVTQDFTSDPAKLYVANFEPFENFEPGIERSLEKTDLNLRQQAFFYYDQGNYEEALNLFKQLNREDNDPVSLWLYMGNAYMALNDTQSAIPLLHQVVDINSGFVVHAKWYLALCYLKEGNKDEAIRLFTDVVKQGKFMHEEAAKILAKIE